MLVAMAVGMVLLASGLFRQRGDPVVLLRHLLLRLVQRWRSGQWRLLEIHAPLLVDVVIYVALGKNYGLRIIVTSTW